MHRRKKEDEQAMEGRFDMMMIMMIFMMMMMMILMIMMMMKMAIGGRFALVFIYEFASM